jgi:hypothetical protein
MEPTIKRESVATIEAKAQEYGKARRLALTLCASDAGTLLELAQDAPIHAEAVLAVRELREHLCALLEAAEAAERRLAWAGAQAGALPNGWRVV